MKFGKSFTSLFDDAKSSDEYWVEKAKLDFSIALDKQRTAAKMTYAAIAKKIGTSAAYITKVFRGDSNLTIETMVKLARATGGSVQITIVDSVHDVKVWEARAGRDDAAPVTTVASATIIDFPDVAANHGKYDFADMALAA